MGDANKFINVKKQGRVRHLPDSRLKTSLYRKEHGEKQKYTEFLAATVLAGSSGHFSFLLPGSLH